MTGITKTLYCFKWKTGLLFSDLVSPQNIIKHDLVELNKVHKLVIVSFYFPCSNKLHFYQEKNIYRYKSMNVF